MVEDFTFETIFVAFLGGILPALFWLRFWLREDKLHPEPKRMIILTFIGGMVAVWFAFHLEKFVKPLLPDESLSLLTVWALIEEAAKFAIFALIAFKSKDFDEPVDATIYLISVSLGFAALENTLFLITPLSQGLATEAIILGNFRFIGAMLLHVISSASIGIAIGLSFFDTRNVRYFAMLVGCIIAVSLHTAFNFSIMETAGEHLYLIFGLLWLSVVVLLLLFERVKRVHAFPVKVKKLDFPQQVVLSR